MKLSGASLLSVENASPRDGRKAPDASNPNRSIFFLSKHESQRAQREKEGSAEETGDFTHLVTQGFRTSL
jgi:hypothetical protein